MNKRESLFAMTSVALAITCVWLSLCLRDERAALSESLRHNRELERIVAERTEQTARAAEQLAAASLSRTQEEASPTPPSALPTVARAGEQSPSGEPAAPSPRAALPFPQLTPEERRLTTLTMHGELFTELGLSPTEVQQMLTILVRQEDDVRRAISASLPSTRGARDPQQVRAIIEQRKREGQAEIVAALGPDKAARYSELERTLPARFELRDIRAHLEAAGMPVDEAQKEELLELLTALGYGDPPPELAALDMEQAYRQFNAWRRERDERLLEAADSVLSEQQTAQLVAYKNMQRKMIAEHSARAPEVSR